MGAVTSAELLAVAAFNEGKFAQAFPAFGVERRGSPVQAFCRISDYPIRLHEHVYTPDYLIVLDETLLQQVNVFNGFKKNGVVLIASRKNPSDFNTPFKTQKVFTVDAYSIASAAIGKPIINTAMLGAFARVTGLVSLESLRKAVFERFSGELAEKNAAAVTNCFNGVCMSEVSLRE